jgi:hypothetical protein
MVGHSSEIGPRLEALLDERDHLRIKINLAEEGSATDQQLLAEMRRQLVNLDYQILKQWRTPDA